MSAVLGTFRLVMATTLLFAAFEAKAADKTGQQKAQQKAQQRAQQKEQAAIKAYAAGDYAKALDAYAQLYADTLHPVYLRNIGRCHQKMRNPEKAIDAFRDYLAKIERVTDKDRKEVEAYIKEMENAIGGHRKIETPLPPEPEPAPAPVLPAPTAAPEQPVQIVAMPQSTNPTLEDEAPVYKKWWFWTGVGAVVAGAVVVGIVLSSGGSSRPGCPPGVVCL